MKTLDLPLICKYALDQIQDAVILVDENHDILFFNTAAETLAGKPRANLVGHSCRDLFGESNDDAYCVFESLAPEPGERVGRRTVMRHKDGRRVPVEMCLIRVPDDIIGEPLMMGIIRDISALMQIESQIGQQDNFEGIITRSSSMKRIFSLIDSIADTEVSVLIQGESGTGKELVAHAIHKRSPRKDGPFHAVNCGALTLELLDSEIFGHEKGAFTGAIQSKKGRLELADGGTLFLDEVGDMPPALQVKLLRVLQEHKFERVGGTKTLEMKARIIAATNVNLEAAVRVGRFRKDLFYRLHVVPIHLPPLRDREEDIDLLAEHFLRIFAARTKRPTKRFSPESMRILMDYNWPGNVRELINTIEYAVAVSPGESILPQDIPERVRKGGNVVEATIQREQESEQPRPNEPKSEKDAILQALVDNGYKREDAAKALGMSRTTLWRKMRELNLG